MLHVVVLISVPGHNRKNCPNV